MLQLKQFNQLRLAMSESKPPTDRRSMTSQSDKLRS